MKLDWSRPELIMRNIVKKQLNHRSGFLLIETLIGTVFCLLAVWTIAFVLTATTKFHDDSIIRYHLLLQRLEGDDFLFTIKKFSATEIELHSIVTDKNYKLTKYCNYVRITGIKKGHIPVLKNVKNIEWQRKKVNQIQIKGEFENDKKFSSTVIFQES